MKGFVSVLVALCEVGLLLELFCPQGAIKKAVIQAFSIVLVVIIVSQIKNISVQENSYFNYNEENLIHSQTKLSDSFIEITSSQLKTLIFNEVGEEVDEIIIDYDIDDLNTTITGVTIKMKEKSVNEKKIKNLVAGVLTTLNEEDIKFC